MIATTLASSAVGLHPTGLYSVSSTLLSYLETGVSDAFQIPYSILAYLQDPTTSWRARRPA